MDKLNTVNNRLNILGVSIEAVDLPLVQYWQQLIPHDFAEDNRLAATQFEFEMSGITRGEAAISKLSEYCPVTGKVFLDVGSGNGGMCIAAALAGAAKVHGLEYLASRIKLSLKWAECRNVNIEIRQGVAEQMPYSDASIDILFMSSVIEHVNSHRETLSEITRVLRPGGYAIIEGPNRLSPHWIVSDPHYKLAAVSVLPRPIAKWWVCTVKKAATEYSVGKFPVYSRLEREFRRQGFDVVESYHGNYMIQLLQNPEQIKSRFRVIGKALKTLKLNGMICTVIKNTSPTFGIVLRRQE
jgi:ubiquinone/menaquinone biosynthesis C-methylase UbiE